MISDPETIRKYQKYGYRYSCGIKGIEKALFLKRSYYLEQGQELILKPEPNNPHDPKAVMVLDQDDLKLGYLPSGKDPYIAGLLTRKGFEYSCKVSSTDPWDRRKARITVHYDILKWILI